MSATAAYDQWKRAYALVEHIATKKSPLRFRLLKFKPEDQERIIRSATDQLCHAGVPLYIAPPELWPIFRHAPNDPRTFEVVHKALDRSRPRRRDSRKPNLENEERLSRFTDFGNRLGNPETLERNAAEEVALGAPEVQAKENASFMREAVLVLEMWRRELDEYEAKLGKAKHRKGFRLLREGYSYREIRELTRNEKGKLGISERILTPLHDALVEMRERHRAALREIAERILVTDVDGLPYVEPEFTEDPSPYAAQAEDSPEPGPEIPIEKIVCIDRHGNTASEMTGTFAEPPVPGVVVAPSGDVAISGGHRATATYAGGEDAQFDARDKLDRADSANHLGAPKIALGFSDCRSRERGSGSKNGQHALTRGYLFPTREEMLAGPGYRQPAVRVPPIGAHVRHRHFGDGVVLGVIGSDDAPTVQVNFAGETREILHTHLEVVWVLPTAAPDRREAHRDRIREQLAVSRELRRAVSRPRAPVIPPGHSAQSMAEIRRACEAAGVSLDGLLGERAPWIT